MPINLIQLREIITDAKSAYEGTAPGHYEPFIPHDELCTYDDLLALIDTAEAAIEFHSAYFTGETINLELRRLRETLNHYTTT
jgi:hypothetical protein